METVFSSLWHACHGSHEIKTKKCVCIKIIETLIQDVGNKGKIMELSQIKVLWERLYILMYHFKWENGKLR